MARKPYGPGVVSASPKSGQEGASHGVLRSQGYCDLVAVKSWGPMLGVLEASASDGLRAGLVVTTFGFGLRHGVDWDHIAAITDITSSQDSGRRSLLFATLYALGHGTVVFALGSLAILAGDLLPGAVDAVMERVVGVTLLLLGVYVFYALLRHGRDFRMRSRWMLLFSAASRARRRLRRTAEMVEIEHDHEHRGGHGHADEAADGIASPSASLTTSASGTTTRHRHRHRHVASVPNDPFANYGKATSYVVGMLHGVGAETATQVLGFLAAAKAGGGGPGELLLVVFVLGLLTSNSAIALASTFGFLNASRSFRVYAGVAILTGLFSLTIGSLFILGKGAFLPAIFGG